MLQLLHEYLLAQIGFYTAENEIFKSFQTLATMASRKNAFSQRNIHFRSGDFRRYAADREHGKGAEHRDPLRGAALRGPRLLRLPHRRVLPGRRRARLAGGGLSWI